MARPFPVSNIEPDAVDAFTDGHDLRDCLLLSIAVSLRRAADSAEPRIVRCGFGGLAVWCPS